jgi:hypothetical protein
VFDRWRSCQDGRGIPHEDLTGPLPGKVIGPTIASIEPTPGEETITG